MSEQPVALITIAEREVANLNVSTQILNLWRIGLQLRHIGQHWRSYFQKWRYLCKVWNGG